MDIDREMADLVEYAGRLSRLFAELGEDRLTRPEAAVLNAVAERPRRVTELARLVGLTQPRITTLAQALEQRGMAARAPDPGDGRAVLVGLTEQGRAVVSARRRRIFDALSASGLDAGDVVAGAAALRVVVEALDQSDSRSRTIPATGIETQSGRLLSS